jgi:TonB family protein
MAQAYSTGEAFSAEGPPAASVSAETPRTPRLALEKTEWLEQFVSSVTVLARGPAPPKQFLGDPYFRDCWIDQRFPTVAFASAVALQILLILFPPPIWNVRPPSVVAPPPQMELTWFGPVKDLPSILPAAKMPKSAPRDHDSKTPPRRGADAFHPRQTIISEPLHPTHPRQTLIQPAAPPQPPKILPALPNIVQLAGSQPTRPKLQLTPKQLAAMRPKALAAHAAPESAAPDVSTPQLEAGVINIASSAQAPPKPVIRVSPMSAPRAMQQKGDTNAAAPDIAARMDNGGTLIALSATPAPVAPPPAIPPGNLSARISISPDGPQSGTPGGTRAGSGADGGNSGGGGGRGPEGIFISGGNNSDTAPVSGLRIGPSSRGTGNALPAQPVPRLRIAPRDSNASPFKSSSAQSNSKLDVPPEKVLGDRQVYTLYVNMPNLTSATGSWVLNFAELDEMEPGVYSKPSASDLAGPVPLRKVDPRYPPELRTAHVEGEVILYAIIRKDGGVDSIQLVHSVDPRLDANAMEALAQWKFQPGEKRGEPIDLEAVVHIPFRSRASQF